MNPTTIGKRIKEHRLSNKWSQAKLAQKSHLTPAAVCQYELGTRIPTGISIFNMCKAMKVSADYLLGLSTR